MCLRRPAPGAGAATRRPALARTPIPPRLWRVNARRPQAFVAALLALTALSSCGVNFGAQTNQVYAPSDGQSSYDGAVDVINALIVSDSDGRGRLIAGLVNNDQEESDALLRVSGAGEDQGLTASIRGETEIPASGLVQLARDDAAVVVLEGDAEQLRPGAFVRVTFTFENADPATINVPVLPPGRDYADVDIPEDEPLTGTETDPETEG